MILKLLTLHNNISSCTIEELKKYHEEIYVFIKEPNNIKIDGVNPLKDKMELIENAKNTLTNIEKELVVRGEKVPQYKKLKNLILRLLSKF